MAWSLAFEPFLPWWVLATLAGLAGLVAILLFWRGARGGVLRAITLAALLLALANPVLLREERQPLESTVALVVDRSASQRIAGREAETLAAAEALAEEISAIPGMALRRVDIEDGAGEAEGTRAFTALSRLLEDVPPERVAGVVMLTDGQVHDVPEGPEEIGLGAPLHALVTGRANERDRRVALETSPRFGLVGEEQTINFRVLDEGEGAPATPGSATVTVSRDGETIATRRVRIGEQVSVPVEITHAGETVVAIEAEPLQGEITALNNQVVLSVQGVRENLRVLLVSGEPHAGERTWRNLLKSDASVDLVHFTILRPPEKQDGTPIHELSLIAFPTRELFSERIEDFDLIIFDRYQRRNVLPLIYFDNIAEYVRGGGAVLVAAGPDYASAASLYETPLVSVLPAAPTGRTLETPYRAELTESGRKHPVTRDLPGAALDPPGWSRWFRLVEATASEGEVVMSGAEDKPLLVLNRIGEGRVALLLSDHAWLWARGFEGGGPYVPLLRRLSHWLMAEPDLEEEKLSLTRSGADLVIERRSMEETVPPVRLTRPDGTVSELTLEEVEPGSWQARVVEPRPGLYRAENGTLTALTHIGPLNPREYRDVVSATEPLTPIAEATGGSVRRIEAGVLPRLRAVRGQGAASGRDWIGLRDRQAYLVTGVRTVPLFAGFLGLALLLGAATATWWREGR
jgi:hypothetical protein